MRQSKRIALYALLWIAITVNVHAGQCTPTVRDGWIRLLPGNMPMLAGFGRIRNDCPMPISIIAAHSVAFDSVELHQTRIVNGISQMRPVQQLQIAAHETAVFAPGSLHLMLMQPRTPLKAGDKIAIEFKLADGRTLLGKFEAKKLLP